MKEEDLLTYKVFKILNNVKGPESLEDVKNTILSSISGRDVEVKEKFLGVNPYNVFKNSLLILSIFSTAAFVISLIDRPMMWHLSVMIFIFGLALSIATSMAFPSISVRLEKRPSILLGLLVFIFFSSFSMLYNIWYGAQWLFPVLVLLVGTIASSSYGLARYSSMRDQINELDLGEKFEKVLEVIEKGGELKDVTDKQLKLIDAISLYASKAILLSVLSDVASLKNLNFPYTLREQVLTLRSNISRLETYMNQLRESPFLSSVDVITDMADDKSFDTSYRYIGNILSNLDQCLTNITNTVKEIYLREGLVKSRKYLAEEGLLHKAVIDFSQRYSGAPPIIPVIEKPEKEKAPPPKPPKIAKPMEANIELIFSDIERRIKNFSQKHDISVFFPWRYSSDLLVSYSSLYPRYIHHALSKILALVTKMMEDKNIRYACENAKIQLTDEELEDCKSACVKVVRAYLRTLSDMVSVSYDDEVKKELLTSLKHELVGTRLLIPIGLPHLDNILLSTVRELLKEFENALSGDSKEDIVKTFSAAYLIGNIIRVYNTPAMMKVRMGLHKAYMG